MTKYHNHTGIYFYWSLKRNCVQPTWEELLLPPSFFFSSSCLILIGVGPAETRSFPLHPLTNRTTLYMFSQLHRGCNRAAIGCTHINNLRSTDCYVQFLDQHSYSRYHSSRGLSIATNQFQIGPTCLFHLFIILECKCLKEVLKSEIIPLTLLNRLFRAAYGCSPLFWKRYIGVLG